MTDFFALRSQLDAIVAGCAPESLSELIATLDAAKVRALTRLIIPAPASPQAPAERLVGAAEMAGLLGLPEHWVRDHARRKLIPSLKVGHYVVFDPRAVIAAVRTLGGAQDQPSCGGSGAKPRNSKRLRRSVQPAAGVVDTESVHDLVSGVK